MLTYSTDISERYTFPYIFSIQYEVEIYLQDTSEKFKIVHLRRKDNSKNTTETVYGKEHYSLHTVDMNFNLIIFKI